MVARRDVRSLSREKTIVLALLIQLFVAGFSSFLVVGLTSLYDPGSVSTGEVEMAVTGDARDELLEAGAEQDQEPEEKDSLEEDQSEAEEAPDAEEETKAETDIEKEESDEEEPLKAAEKGSETKEA